VVFRPNPGAKLRGRSKPTIVFIREHSNWTTQNEKTKNSDKQSLMLLI